MDFVQKLDSVEKDIKEFLHAAVGLVKAPVITTVIQISSRLMKEQRVKRHFLTSMKPNSKSWKLTRKNGFLL
jgi:ubiquinone biosynthesis protein UbiJ